MRKEIQEDTPKKYTNAREIEANRIWIYYTHTSVLLNSGTYASFFSKNSKNKLFRWDLFLVCVDFSFCCGVFLWNVSVLIIAQIIYTTRSIEKFESLMLIVFAFKFIDIRRNCPLDVNKLKNHRFQQQQNHMTQCGLVHVFSWRKSNE